MLTTIIHPDGALKACIAKTRDGGDGEWRVVLYEKLPGSSVTRWERGGVQVSPNWSRVWCKQYDCAFHVLCDRVHDHVMASRRDVLIITL
jgi:hypothetical protein